MAVLKRVGLYYPALAEKNKMSDKYQLNIGNLTPEHEEIITGKLGVDADQIKDPKQYSAKEDPDGKKQAAADAQGRFIVARSSFPIKVTNGKKQELPDDVVKTIGNGSVANVQVNSYDWDFRGKSGTSAGVQQVMLLKRVKYEGFTDELEEEEDELEEADAFDELEEDDIDLD